MNVGVCSNTVLKVVRESFRTNVWTGSCVICDEETGPEFAFLCLLNIRERATDDDNGEEMGRDEIIVLSLLQQE